MNWGWSEILWVSLISICLVFFVLLALVWVMKAFGACFRAATPRIRKGPPSR